MQQSPITRLVFYRLLKASDDSGLRTAMISLNSMVRQAPFDNCLATIRSRHITLSEFRLPGNKNLSSCNLAMHVSAT